MDEEEKACGVFASKLVTPLLGKRYGSPMREDMRWYCVSIFTELRNPSNEVTDTRKFLAVPSNGA